MRRPSYAMLHTERHYEVGPTSSITSLAHRPMFHFQHPKNSSYLLFKCEQNRM
jgi:hypothetical protein